MIKKEHTILNEKYRPDTLEGYLCTGELKPKLEEYIKKQDIPMLGFFGLQGSGKTTLAKILVKNINCDYLLLNATEDRSMESIKEKVGAFASSNSFKPIKVVILDEATHMLQASQVLLLNMIEQFSLKTRFILTGNYPERLIPALRSRLQEFALSPPSKKQIAEHVSNILEKEEIEHDIKDLAFIVNRCYPDIRKTINTCQKFTIDNKLIVDQDEVIAEDEYINKIIAELKKPSIKSFNAIRQIIADSDAGDFDSVYKQLYDRLNEYALNNEGSVTCILEEIMFHRNFRVDQEISLMTAISKILDIVSVKKVIKG